MRGIFVSGLIGLTLSGCLGGGAVPVGGSGGTSATGGANASGGASVTGSGGSNGSGGAIASGGSNGSGGSSTGSGGSSTGSGGSSTGSGGSEGGSNGSGGRIATGGSTGTGGRAATGGATGTGGAATGTGGAATSGIFPMPLRVDDPCSSLLGGNVCLHQGKTSDNGTPFTKMGQLTVGGTPGTMYMVKIRVRGVTEPTHVMGGTAGTPTQFVTGGSAYPNNTNEGQYQQWRLTTTVPNKAYFLNVFSEGLSHVVKLLDYSQTIMIGGGSIITLDVNDGNAHQISNTVNNPPLMPTGVPGSMMNGQFVQIDEVLP